MDGRTLKKNIVPLKVLVPVLVPVRYQPSYVIVVIYSSYLARRVTVQLYGTVLECRNKMFTSSVSNLQIMIRTYVCKYDYFRNLYITLKTLLQHVVVKDKLLLVIFSVCQSSTLFMLKIFTTVRYRTVRYF